jgi:alpha-galactosidase
MPGGVLRALRMIPALIAIAGDVEELCPGAWFVNYSNPMTANCTALRRVTGIPVVGLCHGTFQVERQLAAFAGADPEATTSLFGGPNHLTFIFDLRERGADLWPGVRERVARDRAAGRLPNPFSWSLFDAHGAYPAVNDRHVVEFFPERFPGGRYHARTLGIDAFPFEAVVARGDERYAQMRARALGEEPLDESIFARAEGEHEQLLDILRSLARGERRVFAVNVENRGAVPGLPADAVLELPAAATATGLRPLQLPDFPAGVAELLAPRIEAIELTVEAALRGDRGLVVDALLADGAVTERATATSLADELLEAQRPHLPQFF